MGADWLRVVAERKDEVIDSTSFTTHPAVTVRNYSAPAIVFSAVGTPALAFFSAKGFDMPGLLKSSYVHYE